MNSKYDLMKIAKLLEKLFNAGFNTDKSILAIKLEDLQKIPDITSIDIMIILDLKKAIKNKKLIAFLSGYEEKRTKKERDDLSGIERHEEIRV